MVGAVLGAGVGFIPGVAVTYPLTGRQWMPPGTDAPSHFLAVPWLMILGLVVAAAAADRGRGRARGALEAAAGGAPRLTRGPAGWQGAAVSTRPGGFALDDGSIDDPWIHGHRRGMADADPALQVRRLDADTFVLRQSKACTFEAPFLHLLLGRDRALLLDTGAVKDEADCPVRARRRGAGRRLARRAAAGRVRARGRAHARPR